MTTLLTDSQNARNPNAGLGRAGLCRAGRRRLFAAVTAEDARRGKLTELVSDHVFLDKHLQKLVPVVNLERMAHEFRNNRAGARPRLERLLGTILIELGHL